MRLTKPQLQALKSKWEQNTEKEHLQVPQLDKNVWVHARSRYRSFLSFRRSVFTTFGNDGAVTVMWCGMWLCIERDGYTHT